MDPITILSGAPGPSSGIGRHGYMHGDSYIYRLIIKKDLIANLAREFLMPFRISRYFSLLFFFLAGNFF